jgi:cytochrome c556
MRKTLIRLLTISCLLAAGSLNSVAQEKKPVPDKAEVIFKVIGPKFAFGKVVKGAPYSATAITEHVQTLSDGNQIIRKNESKLYRDSEGRTRTEQTLETIGKWTSGGEAQQNIFINDPVAGVSYSIDPRVHTAHKTVYPQKKRLVLTPNGPNGTYVINGQTVTQAEFEAAAEKKLKAHEEMLAKERKEGSNAADPKTKLEMLQQGSRSLTKPGTHLSCRQC